MADNQVNDEKEVKRRKQLKKMTKILAKAWELQKSEPFQESSRTSTQGNVFDLASLGEYLSEGAYKVGRSGWVKFAQDIGGVYNRHIERCVIFYCRHERCRVPIEPFVFYHCASEAPSSPKSLPPSMPCFVVKPLSGLSLSHSSLTLFSHFCWRSFRKSKHAETAKEHRKHVIDMLAKLDESIAAEVSTRVPSEDVKPDPKKRKQPDQGGGSAKKKALQQSDGKMKTTLEMTVEDREASAVEDLIEAVKTYGGENWGVLVFWAACHSRKKTLTLNHCTQANQVWCRDTSRRLQNEATAALTSAITMLMGVAFAR
jgi:hypothetical protein